MCVRVVGIYCRVWCYLGTMPGYVGHTVCTPADTRGYLYSCVTWAPYLVTGGHTRVGTRIHVYSGVPSRPSTIERGHVCRTEYHRTWSCWSYRVHQTWSCSVIPSASNLVMFGHTEYIKPGHVWSYRVHQGFNVTPALGYPKDQIWLRCVVTPKQYPGESRVYDTCTDIYIP